jgi:hypothetical protein
MLVHSTTVALPVRSPERATAHSPIGWCQLNRSGEAGGSRVRTTSWQRMGYLALLSETLA